MVENGWYESVSLSDYVGVVWRRKWIALLVTVMVTAAAFGFSERQQKLYSASSQLVNTTSSSASSSSKSSSGNTWSRYARPAARRPSRARSAVISQSHLTGISPAQLLSETTVRPTPTVDAIDFTVTDPSPAVAQQLANAWAAFSGATPTGLTRPALHQSIQKLGDSDHNGDSADRAVQPMRERWHDVAVHGGPGTRLTRSRSRPTSDTLVKKSAQLTNSGLQLQRPRRAVGQPDAAQDGRNAAIGLVLGLILGVILAFLQDLLDTRIRTVDEVGRRLRLPLLASIPSRPRALRDQAVVLMSPQGGAQMPTAEAFRILKLNLSSTLRRGMKVIMFTSASDDEGISTTVANLAVALTRAGQHVVVVDANMRRPALGGFFGLDDRMGVSDILSGHSQLGDALTIVDVSREHAVESELERLRRRRRPARGAAGRPDPGRCCGAARQPGDDRAPP